MGSLGSRQAAFSRAVRESRRGVVKARKVSRSVTVAFVSAVVLLLGTVGLTLRRAGPPSFLTAPRERQGTPRVSLVRIGMATLAAEVARTPDEWARGLSGRDTLPQNAGMLFIFPTPTTRVFWMKDTRVPLDIIWIRDGRVAGITADVQPEQGVADSDLRRYVSSGPVSLVVEANGGWARASGVRVGDRIIVL